MTATRTDIDGWFDRGVAQGASHMIVMCDTYDWDDYPVYVKTGDNPRRSHPVGNMQKVMECYNLSMDKAEQMAERRANHWEK